MDAVSERPTPSFSVLALAPASLLGEKRLQHCNDLGDLYRGHVPDDLHIDVGVVVSHDVAHAAHLAERQRWDRSAGFLV